MFVLCQNKFNFWYQNEITEFLRIPLEFLIIPFYTFFFPFLLETCGIWQMMRSSPLFYHLSNSILVFCSGANFPDCVSKIFKCVLFFEYTVTCPVCLVTLYWCFCFIIFLIHVLLFFCSSKATSLIWSTVGWWKVLWFWSYHLPWAARSSIITFWHQYW